MNCEQARLEIGADPRGGSPALEQHLGGCADCSGYRREMRELEARLARALALPVAATRPSAAVVSLPVAPRAAAPDPAATQARTGRGDWRGWALAASVLLTLLLGVFVAGGRDGDALATELVGHMAGERDSWDETRPLPQSALDLVLRRSNVRLDRAALGEVVYAHSCWFRGHWVPHLVLRTASGPVTVMVLPAESIAAPQRFDESGYAGVIAPAAGGAVAVLSRDDTEVDEPLARVQRALERSSQPVSTDQPP
jgi:hypothetical protein